LAYLRNIEAKLFDSESMNDLNRWVVLGTYSVITYLVSLRGSEGFLLDLGGLRVHKIDERTSQKYFLIPLMGKVKGEHHDRCHLIRCMTQTDLGIRPYQWVKMLVQLKERQGLTEGPAISDEKGRVLTSSTIDQAMHEVLEDLVVQHQDLFPSSIISRDDIESTYHAFRSFRRSSDTGALNRGVR
jgi:hypothetical protein